MDSPWPDGTRRLSTTAVTLSSLGMDKLGPNKPTFNPKRRGTMKTQAGSCSEKGIDSRVTLNVGGTRHMTWASTLERIPNTRLALVSHLREADENYVEDTAEYFFDRHPRVFENIIQYYRTEELHLDHSLCGNVLKKELEFWGIAEQDIEACCWADYSRYTEHKQTLRELDDNFAYEDVNAWEQSDSNFRETAAKIWEFLEEPGSSRGAKAWAWISMLFVAISILVFVLETHKMFQVERSTGIAISAIYPEYQVETPTGSNAVCCCEPEEIKNGTRMPSESEITIHPALVYIDYICVAFFTFEILVRFGFAPNKCAFWKSALNVIDIMCLVPHYIAIVLKEVERDEAASAVKIIMMMRIIRVLRIFKLMKHYSAFKILVYTIKVSTKELLLMVVFLMSGVLMFASIIHYAEKDNFPNIPIAIWWALVTMTTVGYGDKYPVGYVGYGIGCVCVISGVLVIAFTVPIVVNNFSLYYSHAQTRIKMPNRKKKDEVKKHMTSAQRQRYRQSLMHGRNPVRRLSTLTPSPHQLSVASLSSDTGADPSHKNEVDNNRQFTQQNKPTRGTAHADNGERPTPVESTEIEDLDSLDSGIGDAQKINRQYQEETQHILVGLEEAKTKSEGERRRQELLVRQRRDNLKRTSPGQAGSKSGAVT